MKKIFSILTFLTIFLFGCKKADEVNPNIPDNTSTTHINGMPTIQDVLGISNEPKSGTISNIVNGGININSSAGSIISGGTNVNSTIDIAKIKLGEVEVSKNTAQTAMNFSTGLSQMSTLKNYLGSTQILNYYNSTGTIVSTVNHRIPLDLRPQLNILQNNTISKTSTVTWNRDINNSKGVSIIITSVNNDNLPLLSTLKQLQDTGNFTFRPSDFTHVLPGQKCQLTFIRANADKAVINNENFYFSSGTIVNSGSLNLQ